MNRHTLINTALSGDNINTSNIFPRIRITIIKVDLWWYRPGFIIGIPTPVRRHPCTTMASWSPFTLRLSIFHITWWRHQMETFSALLSICAGNSPVPSEFPAQRPVTRSFVVSLICVWIIGWVNNREAGDLRRYRAHYDVIVMRNNCAHEICTWMCNVTLAAIPGTNFLWPLLLRKLTGD